MSDPFLAELAFVFERYRTGAPSGKATVWLDCLTWCSGSRVLRFQAHTNIRQSDVPWDSALSVCVDFTNPDTPVCTMRPSVVSTVLPSAGDAVAAAVNRSFASSATPTSVLMRIAVIMKEVSKAVDTLWPATDSSKHLLHRYVQSISLRLTDSSEEQLRGLDALLSLFSVPLTSVRRSTVCLPTPPALYGKHDELFSALTRIPPLLALASSLRCTSTATPSPTSQLLYDLPSQVLQLLGWIIGGTPSQLTLVSDPNQSAFPARYPPGHTLHPDQEYDVIAQEDPVFTHAAALHGTVVGYHGSSSDNLHSILHNGLRSLSHSRQERNGSMLGAGVYLAGDVSVAHSFAAATGKVWSRSVLNAPESATAASASSSSLPIDGDCAAVNSTAAAGNPVPASTVRAAFACVFQCDIVNLPQYHKTDTTSSAPAQTAPRSSPAAMVSAGDSTSLATYFVVPDSRHVRLRRMFVYNTHSSGPALSGSGADTGTHAGGGAGARGSPSSMRAGVLCALIALAVAIVWAALLSRSLRR